MDQDSINVYDVGLHTVTIRKHLVLSLKHE